MFREISDTDLYQYAGVSLSQQSCFEVLNTIFT